MRYRVKSASLSGSWDTETFFSFTLEDMLPLSLFKKIEHIEVVFQEPLETGVVFRYSTFDRNGALITQAEHSLARGVDRWWNVNAFSPLPHERSPPSV